MPAFFRSETSRSPWTGILFGSFLALLVIALWETTVSHAAYTVTTETDTESGLLTEAVIREGRSRIKVEIQGEIEISSDERSIERLGEGASLIIEEKRGRERRRFEATPGIGGAPKIAWFVDRQPTAFDRDGEKWLTRILRKLHRTTGHNADGRVARLLTEGGVSAVLSEISKIGSDQVARIYFEEVLTQTELSDDEWPRALRQMAREIGSDRELGRLMQALPASIPGGPAADAWLRATGSIGSDYELRSLLSSLLRRNALDSATAESLLDAAVQISSDHELASFLVDVAKSLPANLPLPESFIKALSTVGSDFEESRTLGAALNRPGLDSEQIDTLLHTAISIGSDFELAKLLTHTASSYPGELPDTYFRAVSTIGSDFELRKTLAAVAARPELSGETLDAVLHASIGIGSDHELSALLRQLLDLHPIDQHRRPAFDRALATISSDHERERVLTQLSS